MRIGGRTRRALTAALMGAVVVAPRPVSAQAESLPPLESIAAVRVDASGDFVPDRLGDTVRVHGIVTSHRRAVGRTADAVFFQDGTGGVTLFSDDTLRLAGIEPGDSLMVLGEVNQHNGSEEIRAGRVVLLGRTAVPAPIEVTARGLLGEEYGGRLVRVRGRLVHGTETHRLQLMVQDSTGGVPVYIRPEYLEDEEFTRALYSARRAEVVGIASQSTRVPPYNSGYDLIPRTPEDMILFPAPPLREMGVAAAMGLLVLLLAYVYARRRSAERRADRLRRLKDALERRDAILRSVAFAAERFLVDDELDTGLAEAAGRLGIAARASACSVLVASAPDGNGALGMHHSATTPITSGEALRELERAWTEEPEMLEWLERVRAGDVVRVAPTSPPVRTILDLHDARLVLLVPILGGAEWWGALAFYYPRAGHRWSGPEIDALKAAGSIIGAAASRRTALSALRDRDEQLRQSQKLEAVGRLAGGIAHDFNNLLTAIGGNAALLSRVEGLGPEDRQEAREIVRAAERAAHLTQQLLAFSRHQVLPSRNIDVCAVVEELRPMLERLIGEHIRLTTMVRGPAWVRMPPGQLEQVIVNLCLNSRDAMRDGGTLRISTGVEGAEDGSDGTEVVLEVADTGTGMDEATLGRAFEPFFTTKGAESGTGLGLSTVYGIVHQAGGSIRMETEPGTGTRAILRLPAAGAPALGEGASAVPLPPADDAHGTILLAEDEPAVRRLAQRVLERAGYTVLSGEDGVAALEVLKSHPGTVDLLLTDVRMPRMNGTDLADAARAIDAGMRVLFMSGYAANELRGREIAPADFIEKPFSPDELVSRVGHALGRAVPADGSDTIAG